MAIRGVGIDTVLISRMHDAAKRGQFLARTFTTRERAYCESYTDASSHFAGTFAAKEAARKATGELSREFSEFEVLRTDAGKPEIWVDGVKRTDLHLSITHTGEYASAVVIYDVTPL
jgi:holo-[acyl-carrier protein] synthase